MQDTRIFFRTIRELRVVGLFGWVCTGIGFAISFLLFNPSEFPWIGRYIAFLVFFGVAVSIVATVITPLVIFAQTQNRKSVFYYIVTTCYYGFPGILASVLVFYISQAWYSSPVLSDVFTDVQDPPLYHDLVLIRPEGSNTLTITPEKTAKISEEYPRLRTLHVAMNVDRVEQQLMRIITAEFPSWLVVSVKRTAQETLLEIEVEGPYLRTIHDLAIRIRPVGSEEKAYVSSSLLYQTGISSNTSRDLSAIDVRSASRILPRDAHFNVSIIRRLYAVWLGRFRTLTTYRLASPRGSEGARSGS